jgi:hypothetical protein
MNSTYFQNATELSNKNNKNKMATRTFEIKIHFVEKWEQSVGRIKSSN